LLLLQSFFSEFVNGLQSANTAACSSSTDAPSIPNAKTPAVELLSERLNQLSVKKETDLGFLINENHSLSEMDGDGVGSRLQDKISRHNEESCSYTSSNRESWGRCSSLGAASDESFSGNNNDKQNLTVKALATPLRTNQRQRQSPRKPIEQAKQKKIQALWKKIKREKVEMGDSLSLRLKMCLGQSPRRKRNRSSGGITTS